MNRSVIAGPDRLMAGRASGSASSLTLSPAASGGHSELCSAQAIRAPISTVTCGPSAPHRTSAPTSPGRPVRGDIGHHGRRHGPRDRAGFRDHGRGRVAGVAGLRHDDGLRPANRRHGGAGGGEPTARQLLDHGTPAKHHISRVNHDREPIRHRQHERPVVHDRSRADRRRRRWRWWR